MLWFQLLFVFVLGAAVGSGINVCAYRLPYEKSVLWPGSRCGHCYQPVRWYDNIPLVSYWVLRGRCRACGQPFSVRYFLVELVTGLLFVGLYYLEIVADVRRLAGAQVGWWAAQNGRISGGALATYAFHAALVSFLLAASLCDLEHMEIPLALTVPGTVLGLLGSVFFPWPWPGAAPALPQPGGPIPPLPSGTYPWPVWYPLPDWLPPGSWRLGLATGLAGAAAGMIVLRAIRFLFGLGRGVEGLGLGDADLMMMAGSFVGWQPVIVALFLAVFPALLFGVVQILLRRGQALPFGPSLAVGVVGALLAWPAIARHYQAVFFEPLILGAVTAFGGALLLVVSFLLRLLRGPPQPEGGIEPPQPKA